jgi:glyoxylase-like metal-dependent hydrolase (beta-lactamase superfamily II)
LASQPFHRNNAITSRAFEGIRSPAESKVQNATLLYADNAAHRTNYDEPARYARGLYDLGQHLYAFLSPNGSWQETNTGLIVGDGESLLVDTLLDLPHTRTMLELMRPFTDTCPIRYVVNTHADGDHCWGNQLVGYSEIISSEACYDEMQELSPKAFMSLSTLGCLLKWVGRLPGLSRYRRIGAWWQEMLAPYDAASVKLTLPSRRFTGELTVHVGGREVRLLEVGPMHTRGDTLVYVPDARLLYAGDALFVEVTPVLWAGPLERWVAALDKILQMDVDCIVPGHGPITNKEGASRLKDYLTLLDDEARRRYNLGMPPQKAAYDIACSPAFTNSPFADWDSPERMLVNVYTLYRWFQGRTEPPALLERLRIFAEEAEFALTFPTAAPARLHRFEVNCHETRS